MKIRPIHTDDDYRAALREASAMFDDLPEPGTERGDYFEVLTTLIEDYEMRTFPIGLPDPGYADDESCRVVESRPRGLMH